MISDSQSRERLACDLLSLHAKGAVLIPISDGGVPAPGWLPSETGERRTEQDVISLLDSVTPPSAWHVLCGANGIVCIRFAMEAYTAGTPRARALESLLTSLPRSCMTMDSDFTEHIWVRMSDSSVPPGIQESHDPAASGADAEDGIPPLQLLGPGAHTEIAKLGTARLRTEWHPLELTREGLQQLLAEALWPDAVVHHGHGPQLNHGAGRPATSGGARASIDQGRSVRHTATPSAWPAPKRIVRYSTEPFPVQALPTAMRAAAEEVARNVVVPIAIPALAFLAVASGLVGAWVDVLVQPGWVRRANLYLAVIAETATGKTPGIGPALAPILQLETEALAELAEEQTRARARLSGLKDDISLARREGRDADVVETQRQIDEVTETLARQVRLKVDDVTPEQLAMLMHGNHGRMLAVNDEGSILGHALGLYTKTPNIDLLVKAFDAVETFHVDRKGSANGPTAVRIERPTLTMLSAIQPTMVDRIGKKPELLERGLVGRVMWCWPQDTVGLRLFSGRPAATTAATDEWNAQLLRMARVRRGNPISVPFTDDGLAAYLDWHDAVEREIPAARALADVRVFVPKVRDAVARTAALFAVLEGTDKVGTDHVSRSILLGEYWIAQALNLIGAWSTATGAYSAAEKVLRWLMRRPDPLAPFTVRDARYNCHLKGDAVFDALEVLEHHGWVRPADPEVGYGSSSGPAIGRKSARVEVNPAAADVFMAHGRHPEDTR